MVMITSSGKHVVDAVNAFTVDLYSILKEQKGNLFLSPWNIATAFAMVYAGAKGDTETQIAEVLHFGLTQRQVHDAFGDLIQDLIEEKGEKGYQLNIANALWIRHGYLLLPDFTSTLKNSYNAEVERVNFDNPVEAATLINTWAAKQTRNKIPKIIQPHMIAELTRLILTSAIYFKGLWTHPFKKKQTQDAPFTLLGGEPIQVPMMHSVKRYNYMETPELQALELPYIGDRLSMVVLLPTADDGLPDLEKNLRWEEQLEAWLSLMVKQKVNVFFPKFTITSEFALNDPLETLGMTDPFSMSADFSGITISEKLFISSARHKAFIEVDEEGTTAAAATAIIMAPTGLPAPIPIFRCDHPFLFLIRDTKTGSVLFLGRMVNPKET
jgi:serpin B